MRDFGMKTRLAAAPVRRRLAQSTALAGVVSLALVGSTYAEGLILGSPGSNTERANAAGFGSAGFSISSEGTVIAGAQPPYNPDRPADLIADAAGLDVRFDGLTAQRLLNVSTADLRAGYRAGEAVRFAASSNYPAYIVRSEVLILDRDGRGAPVVATLPVAPNGTVGWAMPQDGSGNYAYVLRVYDAQGRYDETQALALTRTNRVDAGVGAPFVQPGAGEDRTARRGIPSVGGSVVISGEGAVPNSTVVVMGEAVPTDAQGRFVVNRILPAGDQVVQATVGGRTFVRDVEIPRSDWFYVGLADVSLGRRVGGINDVSETYVNGRFAYYVRGVTESGYTVVSSLDTRDGPLEDVFTRLNDKDPRRVLDRLRADSDELYLTYGDDSTFYDDTPTSGSIYVRIENETTRLTWGDFSAGITGGGLLQNGRDLYGAEVRYASPSVTEDGESRFAIQAYAAQPETRPQRDILRGTGGSIYFLSRQDVLTGTAKITVQIVDRDTGFIVETRELVEGVDYEVDHLQGVIILSQPLNSSGSNGALISDGGADYDVNLVAQYEYSPTTNEGTTDVFGGRIEAWVTNDLRFGATVMSENTGAGDQMMTGVDLRWQGGARSYAELEIAQTDGPGFDRAISTDGGLTIASSGGTTSDRAQALRFDSRFDLQEMGLSREGYVGLYYERKDAGFSTLLEDITSDQTLVGVTAEVALSEALTVSAQAERFERATGEERQEVQVALSYAFSDRLDVEVGVAMFDRTGTDETGTRTDVALRLGYDLSEDLNVYAYGQATLAVDGLADNNRFGAGFSAQVSEQLALRAEVSDGDTGLGGQLRLSYQATADNEAYIGYTLDPTRHGAGSELDDDGTVVLGGRYRVSDTVTTFTENVLDMPGNQTSLTEAYGVTYTPSDVWAMTGTVELGEVRDAQDGDFDRMALSFGLAYAQGDEMSARARIEFRDEDGDGTARDRETWVLTAGYANQVAQDWRLLASVDALYSDSAEGDFRDGEYVRASIGYAYRPVENERLNLLFGLTHLRDLPGEDQVTSDGTTGGPLQISNVLSLGGNYDLNEQFTLGAKLGYRSSEVAPRGTEDFTANTATLLALRVDWHVVHEWDIMAEGRAMFTEETDTTETGAVIGVYRQMNENLSVGVAYEWGSVSDDATDIEYDAQGLMLNIVGQF